ncbi:methyltransferase [Arthrobacter phage Jinkies]|uniref:Methyltransferase n=1 Tax=Arthrobacter phage Jinkies TaxID=2743903 RepID=A0A7S5WS05_9CAUD|nr:methyltransferase [Arthrobacter phage Jinkies]
MRPNIHLQTDAVTIWHGDSIDAMRELPDNSIDSIVTDPPYGLGFMGKAWDALPPGEEWAAECLRVLKPGGHLLAFGGSRTWHRLAVAVEDAGFEIRDSIAWLYGSGFPKSLDVSKAIDKAAGAERAVVGTKLGQPVYHSSGKGEAGPAYSSHLQQVTAEQRIAAAQITAPATEAAQQWQGWGTALKPAFEPVVMGRKPLIGTVAQNVQLHGTGALNIDATRIGMSDADRAIVDARSGADDGRREGIYQDGFGKRPPGEKFTSAPGGRWPANVVLDDTTAAILDGQSGTVKSSPFNTKAGHAHGNGSTHGTFVAERANEGGYSDSGGASRFFYVAKAPKRERPVVDGVAHPTVKPLALMRYLVKLVTPPNGVVLDPFAGSGTTLEACLLEGFAHVSIEREAEYLPLIEARLDRLAGKLPAAA